MDYEKMTSPCGLDCFNCRMYLANSNAQLKKETAEAFGLPYERTSCQGCRNERGVMAFWDCTEPCDVFRCTTEKGLTFCFECPEFPCDYLHPYADKASVRPHNTKVFNLCLIKKMGLRAWAELKAKSVKDTYFRGTLAVHSTEKTVEYNEHQHTQGQRD